MKRIWILLLLSVFLVGCSSKEDECNPVNEIKSDYYDDGDFDGSVIGVAFKEYNQFYSGVYREDDILHVNITEDAPELLIARLNQTSNLEYHFVEYSYAELWAVKEIISVNMVEGSNIISLGIDQKDNLVNVTILIDHEIPTFLDHYIESGIVIAEFGEMSYGF